MKIARFDPSPYGFPKPVVPLLAHHSRRLRCSCRPRAGEGKSRGSFRSFTLGRYALSEAYRLAGLVPGTALLAPAYHCVTMLDPAVNLGADILLYPLNPDLSPDLEGLDDLFADAGSPVRALLATHFFGLPQDFSHLASWCSERDILFIEDCSHVLFAETCRATGIGVFGKFVTSSPYKFFACEDGGLLYVKDASLLASVVTESPRLVDELRGIKRAIEKRWTHNTPQASIEQIDKQLDSLANGPTPSTELQYSDYLHPSSLFISADMRKTALRTSRWLASLSSPDFIARQRKWNYRRWLEAVSGLPNCRALYPSLPEECAPYMFPLFIEHPDPHFFWLKQLGLPIWRWDEMAVSNCAVSREYQLHLLHLPCHQALSEQEMLWMFAVVKNVLRREPRSGFSVRQTARHCAETTNVQ